MIPQRRSPQRSPEHHAVQRRQTSTTADAVLAAWRTIVTGIAIVIGIIVVVTMELVSITLRTR